MALRRVSVMALTMMIAACASGPTNPPRRVAAPTPVVEVAPPAPEPAPEPVTEIRVAILLPLSGRDADVGQMLLNAATMALFDAYDEKLQLIPIDTEGTPAGAARAANAALVADAAFILGPLFADSVRSVAPIVRGADVPLIGFSNDASVAGEGIYLMSFLPDQEVGRVVRYAIAQGHHKIAALIPDTDYGATVNAALRQSVNAGGVTLADTELYPRIAQQLFAPVKRIADFDARKAALEGEKTFLEGFEDDDFAIEMLEGLESRDTYGAPPFDALLIPEGGQLLRTLAPILPFYDVTTDDVRMLGTRLWDDPTLAGEAPIAGGWFAAPDRSLAADFYRRYRRLYDADAEAIATLAYDAMALVALMARSSEGPLKDRFNREIISDPNGFSGINGLVRFRPDGTTERGLAVYRIGTETLELVDPAPTSFQRATADEPVG